jgi:exo-beta-1,3-glucanase (GH17 family)
MVRPVVAWLKAFGVMLIVAAINLAIWAVTHQPRELPDWPGRISGFAFSAFQRYQSPHRDEYPNDDELAEDIRMMSLYTGRIRTYSSAESPTIPRIARANGLQLTAGAWLDRRLQKNEDEIAELIRQVGDYDNIDRAIVGNEVLLRNDLEPTELMRYIERVRGSVSIPVSTCDPWHIWLKYPELVKHVDFICVHLLPYWEGLPSDVALKLALERYDLLQKTYPKKPVVIGEIGWPSNGDRIKGATASKENEATFLRQFFAIARQRGLDYYVMEAFDQPWKIDDEGRAGAYWGVFDAFRDLKFPLAGAVQEDPQWPLKALIASILAVPFVLGFSRKFTRFALPGLLFFGMLIQLAASLLVWQATVPLAFYLRPFDWAMVGVLLPAQLAITGICCATRSSSPRRSGVRTGSAARTPATRPGARTGRSSPSTSPAATNRRDGDRDHRFAGRARLSELRGAGGRQQHRARRGLEAGRGTLPRARPELPLSTTSGPGRGSRPGRSTSPWRRRMRGPRSWASSTPTTWCRRAGCAAWSATSTSRRWRSCRRRRRTATTSTTRSGA